MKITPVNKQIILIVPKIEDELVGGIIMPASVQEKPHRGIVYLSDDSNYIPEEIVLYRRYSGFNFNIEDTEFLCIEAGDILVKIEETPEEKLERETKTEENRKAMAELKADKPLLSTNTDDVQIIDRLR